MKNISSGLKADYAAGTTAMALCWKATLRDGTVITATNWITDIEFPVGSGVVYKATQSYNASDMESNSDLSPDNLEVDGFLASPAITEGDIHSGRWDYASIELFKVNAKNLANGRDLLRKGTLGRVKSGRVTFNAELRGLMQSYSRRIVQLTSKECLADFGDAKCKIDKTTYRRAGTVDAVTDNKIINDSERAEPADWWTGGLITFTSGQNTGLSMEIKSYSPGIIELFEQMPFHIENPADAPDPLPVVPASYVIDKGCMKRFYEDCINTFGNAVNFRGFPHLPGVGVFGSYWTTLYPNGVPTPTPGPTPGPTPAPTPAPTMPPTPAPTSPPISDGSWGTDPALPLAIVTDRWISVGDTTEYYLADNVWGAGSLTRGTYTTSTGPQYETGLGWNYSYGPNHEISWRMAWKWPDGVSYGAQEVKAYPSALIGNKPGYYNSWTTPGGFYILLPDGTLDTRYPSGKTHAGNFFPLAADGHLPTINAAVGGINHLVTPSGAGHLSYDIWLQSSSDQVNGFSAPPISHEIMIPLDLWGHYGEYGYRNPSWYSHDEVIQGILFHIYFVRVFFGGWTFVVYEPDVSAMPLIGTLNLAEFVNKLTTMLGTDGLPMASGTEYLVSVELGVEPNVGIGDLEVQNYRVWKP